MKSPFEKKFCGKSPLKELTAKQEANLPEALKTAIEAKTDSPAKQIDPEKKKVYQDSIQKLHKPAYDAYVKRSKEGFETSDDDDQTTVKVSPRKPEDIKSLKEYAYAMEIGKGGSVRKNGIAASKLAKMYK
tara:strand:+ start:61 stop:453 length:393 start_codon:yes stop_codon:yes gene_type:complete